MSKKKLTTDEDALENLAGFSVGADVKVTDLIPTGHPALDHAISGDLCTDDSNLKGGGLPLGKLVMLYGNEGGGKSSLAYRVVGAAQRKGYRCAWIDTEHSFSQQLAEVNGCDYLKLLYSCPADSEGRKGKKATKEEEDIESGELIMQKMIDAIQSGKINVIVLDSIASLVPEQVLRKDVEGETMATLARVMSKSLPKIAAYAQQNNVLVIFINQLREKIGEMYGNPHTYPGGRSLKHMCSTVIKVMKEGSRDKNEIFITDDFGNQTLVGRYSFASIEKNRFSRPAQGAIRVPIYYQEYFPDLSETVFEIGRAVKLIKVRMNVFSWNDVKAEGKSVFIESLKASGKLSDLIAQIKEQAEMQDYPLPIEIINFKQDG